LSSLKPLTISPRIRFTPRYFVDMLSCQIKNKRKQVPKSFIYYIIFLM
jgi:lipid-A-disaccharide synthase-like uncharacterized protein